MATRIQLTGETEGSQNGSHKCLLHHHLCESALPVVKTGVENNNDEVNAIITGFREDGFSQAVVKAQIGASGIGMMKVTAGEGVDVPDHFFFEEPVLVQVWLKPGEKGVTRMRSPSVQIFLNEDSVFLYNITEHILS